MPSSSDDIVEKIKDLLGPSLLDQAYDLMFGNLIDSFEPFIANRLGPKSGRIFSFGPNSMDGPNVIDKTDSHDIQAWAIWINDRSLL